MAYLPVRKQTTLNNMNDLPWLDTVRGKGGGGGGGGGGGNHTWAAAGGW